MLLMEMWKVLIWSVNCLLLLLCSEPVWHISDTHLGGKLLFVRERVCVCHLNVLPSIDLKTHRSCVPVKTTCGGGSTTHSIPTPLCCSPLLHPPSLFLLFGGVISLYWVTRFPRVTEGTCCSPLDFFTSWTERNFPWYRAETASCQSHLLLIKDWNQELEKVCNLVKVKGT